MNTNTRNEIRGALDDFNVATVLSNIIALYASCADHNCYF